MLRGTSLAVSLLLIAALIAASSATSAAAAPGDLDRSFSDDGRARIDLGEGETSAADVAVDRRGRTILVGRRSSGRKNSGIVRLRDNGNLDRSFAGDGRAKIDFGRFADVRTVAVDGKGRIVVAGATGAGSSTGEFDFSIGVARYTSDGRLDRSFSGDGHRMIDLVPGAGDAAVDIAFDDRGRIVLAGYSGQGSEDGSRFALLRLRRDGDLDEGFGDGGAVSGDSVPSGNAVGAVLDSEGGIVVLGTNADLNQSEGADLLFARYTDDGSLDPDFGEAGVSRVSIPGGQSDDSASDLAIARDGDLLACGQRTPQAGSSPARYDAIAVRLLADGTPDPDFGDDGRTRVDLLGGFDSGAAVLAYRGGMLIGASTRAAGSQGSRAGLVALDPDGELDEGFAGDGTVTFAPKDGTARDDLYLSALARSGARIIAAGSVRTRAREADMSALAIRAR